MMSDQPISISLAVSEVLALLQIGLDSEPSLCANEMNVAENSSKLLGESQPTEIFTHSTAEPTEELAFSLEDHHASRPVAPGSKEAREMTAGYGKKLCVLLKKPSRIASFSKTLLASQTWQSTEYFLRWEVMGLPSEISEILSIVQDEQSLIASWAISKRWVTKRNASIFRLVPWTRRSCDTESGSLASWQTTRADDLGCHNGKMDALPGQLKQTWPTPNASDATSGANSQRASRQGTGGPDLQEIARGQTPYGCLARTTNFVERLTTLSAWLMGYTAQYLARWETRSSRKSPTKSSKPSED